MTSTLPPRVLCIDPGLAAAGFALIELSGYGRWAFLAACTVRTKAGLPWAERLRDLTEGATRWGGNDAAVVECAAASKPFGKAGAVQINGLMMATGALIVAAKSVCPVVNTVSVQQWWPRDGRKMKPEADVVARIRHVVPELQQHSEHAATACALGDWYSRNSGLLVLTKKAS